MMDIRKLKYFIVVAEERHVGRAAARLNISQPPLTRQIKMLEEELGVELFVRTPRGVELTQAGQALLADARNIQSLVMQATDRTQRAGKGQVGRIDVGVLGSGILHIVPTILSAYTELHPDVKLVLHSTPRTQQVEALRQGRALIAFDRYLRVESDIVTECIAREPLMVALNTRNPLATQDYVGLEQLKDQYIIVGGAIGQDTADIVINLCRSYGFEPRLAQEVEDMVTGTALVASGFGVSLVPSSLYNLQLPNLVFRPLRPEQQAYMEMHCYYLAAERSPLLHGLLDVVHTYSERGEETGHPRGQ